MKLGYTVWTWMNPMHLKCGEMSTPLIRGDFEQSLKDLQDLRYQAVECFGFLADYYENDVEGFQALMKRYDLEFVNLYHYFSDDLDADIKNAERYCKFLKAIGADTMNIQAKMWKDTPYNRPFDKSAVDGYIDGCHKIGKICKEYGVKLCLHPHANTAVFAEESLDYFVRNTDPGLVSLCLDTAHTTLAGMDAPKIFDKYADRIGYVHLKDLDPDESLNPEWPMKRFRALGLGCIDFKGVMNSLRKHNYDGVVCVELDYQRVNNYESAQRTRDYIHANLGL